jgi:serine/threonine protein kinase
MRIRQFIIFKDASIGNPGGFSVGIYKARITDDEVCSADGWILDVNSLQIVACKILKPQNVLPKEVLVGTIFEIRNLQLQLLLKSRTLHRRLSQTPSNEHIVRFRGYAVSKEYDKTINLFIEYCPNGDLHSLIQKWRICGACIPETNIKRIYYQISAALKFCHGLRIIHRDVKPENSDVFRCYF